MVIAVSADQPGEALPRVATAQVALDFPEHEARKASVCALDNRLELRKSVAHEAMQQVAGGVAALDGDRHAARPCRNRAGGVERWLREPLRVQAMLDGPCGERSGRLRGWLKFALPARPEQ